MKRTFIILSALALAVTSSFAQLSDEEKAAGWVSLFDGKDASKHWRNFQAEGLNPQWVVADGELTLTEKGGGDIVTKEQYEAFEFIVEYKISKGGNSGLMFHCSEDEKKPWMTGPEIQIQDHSNGKDPQKSGWLYQLYQAEEDAAKPFGEWNKLHVKIHPEGSVVWLNGVKYYEFVKGSDDWNKRVAASKFVKFENFGKPTKGHINLQDHGNVVSFRGMKVK
ncbi:MAG: DUF1080 domain-containing protein, partial [Verrucomicrobiota bacterium]